MAVINDMDFHYEIVSGFVHALSNYTSSLEVYVLPSTLEESTWSAGFIPMLQADGATVKNAWKLPKVTPVDVAVFVSSEWSVDYARKFVAIAKPSIVFVLIHEGNSPNLLPLASVHNNTVVLTLSPHVTTYIKNRLGVKSEQRVEWALPSVAYKPRHACALSAAAGEQQRRSTCLEGFAVQGKFEANRRNYTGIWSGLKRLVANNPHPDAFRIHVHAIGRGNLVQLEVPRSLSTFVRVSSALPYLDYYEAIYHSLGIVPCFASDIYLKYKISSSIVTSVITGVPLIADAQLLEAYSFFKKEHVYYKAEGQSDADAMLAVMQMSPAELFATRVRLQELRMQLNTNFAQLITGVAV